MATEPLPSVRLSIGIELIYSDVYVEVNICEQNYRVRFLVEEEFILSKV